MESKLHRAMAEKVARRKQEALKRKQKEDQDLANQLDQMQAQENNGMSQNQADDKLQSNLGQINEER